MRRIIKNGIIRAGYGTNTDRYHQLYAIIYDKEKYKSTNNNDFISKGTLENIKNDYVEEGLQASQTIENLNKKINNLESLVPARTSTR